MRNFLEAFFDDASKMMHISTVLSFLGVETRLLLNTGCLSPHPHFEYVRIPADASFRCSDKSSASHQFSSLGWSLIMGRSSKCECEAVTPENLPTPEKQVVNPSLYL